MKRQSGFTLVEIAIVLVIIGLLLGGVLKGQELIINAKIKRVNNDFNGIGAAVYSYFERYNAIPGDDAKAATRWPAVAPLAAATAGNGDGEINKAGVACVWNVAGDECTEAWDHMRRSSLVAGGNGPALPISPFGGQIGLQNGAYGMPGTVVCVGGMLGKYGEIVDSQVDDGDGTTGLLRAHDDPVKTTGTAYIADAPFIVCKQL